MSTKIYDGIQIKHMDIISLNKFMKDVRKTLIPIAKKEFIKATVRFMECCLVYINTGHKLYFSQINYKELDELEDKSLEGIKNYVEKKSVEMMKTNETTDTWAKYTPEFDLKSEIYIFPIENKTLGMTFIKNKNLYETFMNLPEVSEYGYWNNVDKPEDISEKEWDIREKDWNEALEGIGIPSENGFCFLLTQNLKDAHCFIWSYEKDVLPYLTPTEIINEQIAKNVLADNKFKELNETKPNEISMNVVRANTYAKEHPEEVKEIAKTITFDIRKLVEEKIESEKTN